MIGSSSSSSSSNKSSVIHSNVKEVIISTYPDLLHDVNEKIYNRFRKMLIKTPVVFVDNIPADVLEWYKTYVFGQTVKLPDESSKQPKQTICAKVSDKKSDGTNKNRNITDSTKATAKVTKKDGGMDVEEAKEAFEELNKPETTPAAKPETAPAAKPETNQSSSQLPIVSFKQPIDDKIEDKKSDGINETANIMDSTKVISDVIKNDENNQMDFEVIKEPPKETSKVESNNQTVEQSSMEAAISKIKANLELSEESSNESMNDDKIEDINEDMANLISSVLATIADEQMEDINMEIVNEEGQRLLEEFSSSQMELNQSTNQSSEEPSHLNITNQSSALQLSEESSNDSTSMDKKDEDNNDKMQNIKFNSNVFAAIDDENNLLDFE